MESVIGGLAHAINSNKGQEFFARWQASQERKRGEGIPAATPATGGEDLGLNMDSSVTKRQKRMRGRRGLLIGSGASGGQTTGIGLNL